MSPEGGRKREQVCKPNSVPPDSPGVATIPLAPALLPGSSDLPESFPDVEPGWAGRATPPLLFGLAPCGVYPAPDIAIGAVRSYLAAGLQVKPGTTRAPKQPAPFHPYPSADGRYVFCGTFRIAGVRPGQAEIRLRPSPLASTLPCGVRTFLSPTPAGPG